MDSLAAEDPTLPLDFNGSSNIYKLPDVSEDGGDLPSAVSDINDRLSALRARTMKDFENQITELKKENFNLKLRIYFLEEQIQQKFDGASEDIYKTNIELKVEVESLKHELHEKQHLLIKASKVVESLAGNSDSKIQRTKEDTQKQIKEIEDFLSSKIQSLEEDLKVSQAKVKTLSTLLEERDQAVDTGHTEIPEMHQKDLEASPTLEEKDRIIEQLNIALGSKESLIKQLEEEKAQNKLCDGSCAKSQTGKSDILQGTWTLNESEKQLADSEVSSCQVFEELEKAKVTIFTLQERLKEADNTNNDLKNCILENTEKLAMEQKNGLKRDKTIQGLSLALKTKERETEEFSQQIERLTLSLSQAREAAHKAQMQKFKGAEDYQAILMEKETLLSELHADNTAKETEIHNLLGKMKKRDQEFSDLRWEKEQLEKELDEAQQLKSRGDKTINDLRNQLEKVHGEIMEKENSLECHYNILLNENSQKFQSQELIIKKLTESLNGKELSFQKLDSAFKEKEVEVEQLFNKYCSLQKAKEIIESSNSCALKEKDDIISHLQQSIVRKNKQLELFEKVEDTIEKVEDQEKESSALSYQHPVEMKKVIHPVFLDGLCQDRQMKNQNKYPFEQEITGKYYCREEKSILTYSDDCGILEFGPRLEPLKQKEPKSHVHTAKEECSNEVIQDMNEVALRNLVMELKSELKCFQKENTLKSLFDVKGNTRLKMNGETVFVKTEMKDAATQIGNIEENLNRTESKHEKHISKEENLLTLKIHKKSRIPVPIKSYRSSIKQGIHTNLQQRAECQEELKVCKMQNKQLQEKLDLAESVIENLKDKLYMAESMIENLKDRSNTNRELLTGFGVDKQEPDGHNSENVLDDPEELKQRVKDMEIQLEKYQHLFSLLQTDNRVIPSDDSFNSVLINLKIPVGEDVLKTNLKENIDDQGQETSLYSSNATEVKRVKFLKQQRMQLKSELQKEKAISIKLLDHENSLQRKLKIMTPSRYDFLVQSQARELSFQRRQMKESFSICIMYHQHLKNLIKAFEELLQASDIDYCVAEEFREQLNQSLQILETLEEKLQNDELSSGSEASLPYELSERHKNGKTTCHFEEHLKTGSPPPSACSSISDFETSDKSSVGSLEDNPGTLNKEHEGLIHLPQNFSQDILMEHLQEIRMLRQRLEESIKTNEKLREQLERQIANAGLDQDKQNENEKLREALSQKTFLVEHIHSDYESIKKENEKLQQQLCARDEEISCLTQDIYKSHNELKRLQSEINLQKHHFYEEKQVQQLLQIEQNLYKKMNEAIRSKKDTDTDAEDMNICKLQYHVFQTHKTCDTCPEDKNIQISSLSNVAALKDNGDSSSECSSSSAASSYAPSRLVPGCHLWADKNGSHILGLIEDYNALRKQITEGRKLVCGMQAYLEDIQSIKPQASRIEIGDQGSSTNFSANVAQVQQTLEEAKRLLKLFWRVSLPINTVHSATHFGQDEEIKSETARLRRKLSEYETKLHSTMKRLYCTNQLKEDMEKVIINQLALTHNVLKKARGNLEIQPVEVQH